MSTNGTSSSEIASPRVGPGVVAADCTAEARATADAVLPLAESKHQPAPPAEARFVDAPDGQEKKEKQLVKALALHVVDCEGIEWKEFWRLMRCFGRCLARAETAASTEMLWRSKSPHEDDSQAPSTIARHVVSSRMPCLPSAILDATSNILGKLFLKDTPQVDRGDRVHRTYKAPAPVRVRIRDSRLSIDDSGKRGSSAVWIDFPILKSMTCTWAQEQRAAAATAKLAAELKRKSKKPTNAIDGKDEEDETGRLYVPSCVSLVPEKGVRHIRIKCIASGGSAIATLRQILRSENGHVPGDFQVLLQGRPTQKPKLMVKLAYRKPRPEVRPGGQPIGLVFSLSNALYAVAADGRSFSRPADELLAGRQTFAERQRRLQRGRRTATGGMVGHGRSRLYQQISGMRGKEAAWMAEKNWKLANDFQQWCRFVGGGYVYAAKWSADVEKLPKEVQSLVLHWGRADLLGKIKQKLEEIGVLSEQLDETSVRCPICADAPLLPWTPNRISHCPACEFTRERDYIRAVGVLEAGGVDVKPIVRKREAEFQAARKVIREAEARKNG